MGKGGEKPSGGSGRGRSWSKRRQNLLRKTGRAKAGGTAGDEESGLQVAEKEKFTPLLRRLLLACWSSVPLPPGERPGGRTPYELGVKAAAVNENFPSTCKIKTNPVSLQGSGGPRLDRPSRGFSAQSGRAGRKDSGTHEPQRPPPASSPARSYLPSSSSSRRSGHTD